MKKYWILALVVVLTMCFMAGCRNRSASETSIPTTTQNMPSTTRGTMPSTTPSTNGSVPSTSENIMTEASEAIDDMIDGATGSEPTAESGAARGRTMKRG